MIAFGLRLTLRGGREALIRLLITAGAVALGVGVLLVTLAGVNGVETQNSRYSWLNSASRAGSADTVSTGTASTPDPLLATLVTDTYHDRAITRVDVAGTGPGSPVPPGLPRLPGPGEYFASPALLDLLHTVPADELGARYPGRALGTIGAAALPSPDSLIVVVGHTPDDLTHEPDAARITEIERRSPGGCAECVHGTDNDGMILVLSVIAAAVLFPILIFIGTATRFAAARREQRFAAMRLVGATPRQVSVVSAVESTVAAIAGTAAGFALFWVFHAPLAELPFTGERFYADDLSLGASDILIVALGVPVAAATAARLALRRVRISPLGVSRRVTPRPPRAYRLIPLVAGIAELTWFIGRRPASTAGQAQAYLGGILLMMIGLIVAGPWLTMTGARVMARRTNRTATLIAGRRLEDNPQAGFRAISGLVVALFVTSTAVGVITTFVAERGDAHESAASRSTLVADFSHGWSQTPGVPKTTVPPIAESVLAGLRALPGVRGVAVIHTNPLGETLDTGGDRPIVAGLMSCRDTSASAGFGHCAPGADVARVPSHFALDRTGPRTDFAGGWPAAAVSSEQLRDVPVQMLLVGTTGDRAVLERVRTAMATAFPGGQPPTTGAEHGRFSESRKQLDGYRQLADVVILVSLCVAGCGLAVSVIAGLNDRKRPFSLLRLAGVRLGTLRRVIALESVVPLLIGAVVAIGAGFLAAQLFLESQLDYTLHAPGLGYYVTVAAGLAASLGVLAATLPLLGRITGPETARNE